VRLHAAARSVDKRELQKGGDETTKLSESAGFRPRRLNAATEREGGRIRHVCRQRADDAVKWCFHDRGRRTACILLAEGIDDASDGSERLHLPASLRVLDPCMAMGQEHAERLMVVCNNPAGSSKLLALGGESLMQAREESDEG
jgi:hypothetical protein